MPLQILKNALGRLVPMPQGLGGLVGNELAQRVNDQTRTALTASLLQAAGPSRMPVSLGQALGGSMANAQNVQMNAINLALQRKAAMDKAQRAAEAQKFLGPILQNMAAGPAGGDLAGNPLLAKALAAEAMIDPQRTLAQLPGILSAQQKSDPLDMPLSPSELLNMQDKNGNPLPYGTTPRQAATMGAQIVSQNQQQAQANIEHAGQVIDQVQNLVLGDPAHPGLFAGNKPGIVNRLEQAAKYGLDYLEQNDPRVAEYQGLISATARPTIRALGEKGALSDSDVQAALKSFPVVWPVPDTEEVARKKLANLKRIIDIGQSNLAAGVDARKPNYVPPLPPGFQLDQ